MDVIRRWTLGLSSYESIAISTVTFIAVAALGESAIQRPILLPTFSEILVFVTKVACSFLVVCIGHRFLLWVECKDWFYPNPAAQDEGLSFVEREEEPSTPTTRTWSLTQSNHRHQSMSLPMEEITESQQVRGTATESSQSSFVATPRPTHHSGILGPSPYPSWPFYTRNDDSSPQPVVPERGLTPLYQEPPTPAAHPRRFGYNGTPATAGFKHFSGMGFADRMKKADMVNAQRPYARVDKDRE